MTRGRYAYPRAETLLEADTFKELCGLYTSYATLSSDILNNYSTSAGWLEMVDSQRGA